MQRLPGYSWLLLVACLYSGFTYAQSAWYAGFSIDPASVTYSSLIDGMDNTVSDNARAVSVEAGYQPLKYLAMELAYHDYGHYKGYVFAHCYPGQVCSGASGELSSHLTGWSFVFMPQIPLQRGTSLFIEGGVLSWKLEGLGLGGAQHDSDTTALYGIGIHYTLSPYLEFKVRYEHAKLNLDQYFISIDWRF